MKKLLTILLTLFLFSSAYAEVRVVDKLEYRDGIAYAVGESEGFSGAYITKHSNGSKELEVNYIDGKRDGLTTKWFNNGNKSSEYLFKLGQRATITKVNNNIYEIVSQEIYNFGNNVNLNHLDTSEVTDMSEIFWHSRFNGDISKWDVSKVTDMSLMFYGSKFNGNISKWDVSNVTDMKQMFSGSLFPYKEDFDPKNIRRSRFNGDISKWDVSNVTDMSGIFKYSRFNGDISMWDVSKVTNMSNMFHFSKFDGDISKWNISNVTNTNERITNWDTIKKTFTCIGEDIEFDLGMQESGNYETYWKDVTLVGDLLTIPDYGEYKRKHLYSTLWNGDYGRASFNPNTKGRLIAERKRYGKHKELQAKCK